MEKSIMSAIITLKETGEFIGQCRIWVDEPKNQDGMFGIAILPQFWDQGYGTEATKFMVDYAFHWLGLHRVSLSVTGGNKRAISVYEKM